MTDIRILWFITKGYLWFAWAFWIQHVVKIWPLELGWMWSNPQCRIQIVLIRDQNVPIWSLIETRIANLPGFPASPLTRSLAFPAKDSKFKFLWSQQVLHFRFLLWVCIKELSTIKISHKVIAKNYLISPTTPKIPENKIIKSKFSKTKKFPKKSFLKSRN